MEDVDFLLENCETDVVVMQIDSRSRDTDLFPDPAEYSVHVNPPLKNVVKVEMIDAFIPSSMYYVDKHNSYFRLLIWSWLNIDIERAANARAYMRAFMSLLSLAKSSIVAEPITPRLPTDKVTVTVVRTNAPAGSIEAEFVTSVGTGASAWNGHIGTSFVMYVSPDPFPETAMSLAADGLWYALVAYKTGEVPFDYLLPSITFSLSIVAGNLRHGNITSATLASALNNDQVLAGYAANPVFDNYSTPMSQTYKLAMRATEFARKAQNVALGDAGEDDAALVFSSLVFVDMRFEMAEMLGCSHSGGVAPDDMETVLGVPYYVVPSHERVAKFGDPLVERVAVFPNIMSIIGIQEIALRCPEVETHMNLHRNDFPGLVSLRQAAPGNVTNLKFEYLTIQRRNMHPIGRLDKLTFRFVVRTKGVQDDLLYDFKGLNHTMMIGVHFLVPKFAARRVAMRHLCPTYEPNFLEHIARQAEHDPGPRPTPDEEHSTSDDDVVSDASSDVYLFK